MNCPKCGLSNQPAPIRLRLLGATKVYEESRPCPICGYESERAKTHDALMGQVYDVMYDHIPKEERLPWKAFWARREALKKVIFGDDEDP